MQEIKRKGTEYAFIFLLQEVIFFFTQNSVCIDVSIVRRSQVFATDAYTGLPLIRKLKMPCLFTDLLLYVLYMHSLSLFLQPSIFLSSFSNSFRFSRKVEEGIWKKAFTTKTKFDRFACFAAYFSSFPKENAVLKKTYEL